MLLLRFAFFNNMLLLRFAFFNNMLLLRFAFFSNMLLLRFAFFNNILLLRFAFFNNMLLLRIGLLILSFIQWDLSFVKWNMTPTKVEGLLCIVLCWRKQSWLGGTRLLFWVGVCRPKPLNPEAISDAKINFLYPIWDQRLEIDNPFQCFSAPQSILCKTIPFSRI